MRNFILGLALLFAGQAMAQIGGNGQMPTGNVYGKVVDSPTGKGLDAATIQLFQTKVDSVTKEPKEVLVTGALAAANGDFRVTGIPVMAQYKLVISGLGHKTYTQTFSFVDRKMMAGGKVDMAAVMADLDKEMENI